MFGGGGADTLIGGGGSDVLHSGFGQDTIVFGVGHGQDVLIDKRQYGVSHARYRNHNELPDIIYLQNVDKESVWFQRDGDDVVISILGTDDSLTIKDLYKDLSSVAHWSTAIKKGGGGVVIGSEYVQYAHINALIQAMAGFAPGKGASAYGVNAGDIPASVQIAQNNYWRTIEP